MKEGWTLAICEYKQVSIVIKHLDLANSLSESILCPLFSQTPYPAYFVSLVSLGNFQDTIDFSQLKERSIQDFSCYDLPASRLVCPMFPARPTDDEVVKSIKMGLEVCSSLGCSSVSLPLSSFCASLLNSSLLLLEGIESYILSQKLNSGCIKEISICCFSLPELESLNEACKFRMTRYDSFILLGLPSSLPNTHQYCFECNSINLTSSNHDNLHSP